ncbi:integrase catalytic domain-containing protein [Trichonephila inaurata madagascariensis]|uniref:Integrase catalytic domain-containing protein n=1 Tax=Trichonephila inaurata madagascariensis TaxID=2747483 RepID=A0A8X7C8K9_9ARAC|nr:integrase catalytic domain-containing protein [Trichonephila inaurata madagascariensis]
MHNEVVHIDGNVMTTLTMHVGNIKLADLWELQHLDNAPSEYCDVVEKLKCSFYVDNCLSGVHNVTEEEYFIDAAKKVLSKGCFNLRGWQSNVACKYVSQSSGDVSVLGMLWNLDHDALRCNINFEALVQRQSTKRFGFFNSAKDRVKDANVFDVTGIDLTGPLLQEDGGRGVDSALYTCAIYRAVHLELVSSLSTECFMLSLRRFIARRNRPEVIYTDNGTSFVGTNRELENLD